ncbi:hypothetical protein [Virgisporangium ochraceum]|uniref:Uncharacterized protein n=1 Tax=Virgisporangium ochraceum TaxID=65505 RepID=A0A8J3ZN16_9ACTN|nr:hypothetical protein [Virgisporangium ochraceum]GIJ66809.1 hypothetical protein Voc01_017260 [Virgisporangium ochraceum]
MRRTGIGVIVSVLLLVGGCVAARDDDPAPDGPPPEPLVALDPFAAAGIRAVRVVPEVDRNLHFDTRADVPPVFAAGGSLVAVTTDREGEVLGVARSADLGRTWRYVDLPGLTASLVRLGLAEAGPLVVATGGTDNDSAWVTGDGQGWRGGPVPTQPGGALLAAAVRQPDGRVVVGTQGSDDARLVVTADGGSTWQVVDCPATFRPAGSPRCEVPRDAGGDLWLRGADVSLDAGRTWKPVTVGTSSVPRVEDAVALPGGGWLGSAVTLTAPTTRTGVLVRSTDGVAWQPVVESPCGAGQGATVSGPRRIGDRWLVTHTCVDADDAPQRSHLYLVDRDGTRGRVLVTVDRPGAWLGAPTAVGDTVVVPEVRREGPVTFLQLRL